MFTPDSLLTYLKRQGIDFTLYHHAPLFSENAADKMPVMQGQILKNLVLCAKGGECLLVTLPLHARADLKAIAAYAGTRRLSFAGAEVLAGIGVKPGMVSPLALLNDHELKLRYLQAASLRRCVIVNCHPLDNSMSVSLKLADLESLIKGSGHTIEELPDAACH